MLELFPRILGYNLWRTIGFPRTMPMNYTVSLLYECNSRCNTCNIYKKKAKNLTVSEYRAIFKSLGHSPYWFTFSGGEPFLREDIDEIVAMAYEYCKPAIINIPTNGILTRRIVEKVKAICITCRHSQVVINLSVDGIGDQHDLIRNVPGNYKKVIATYHALRKLKLSNLTIGMHTVISKLNVASFPSIATQLMDLEPDSYITEIAEERVELDTIGADITPDQVRYRSAIDYLIHRIKNHQFKGMNKITQAFRIEYYNLVKLILRDKTQVIPCYSGFASVQISPDGKVWSCCIKAEPMGDLRETSYKFRKIWFSSTMNKERRSIKHKECYCPLANASYTNMLMNLPTLLRVFYRSFIKWWS